MPTNQEPFLTRRTLGQPNYLMVAVAAAFLIALTPIGAYRALQNNSNNLDAALPATHAEIVDLEWFREQFDGDQFVMVSWDGCTLAEAGRLQRVARELGAEANGGAGEPLFTRVSTGPQVLEQLMAAPYSLPYDVAVRRLEGAIIGPAEAGARGGGDEAQRTTCLAAYLSPFASENEAVRRQAIDRIREVVMAEAHVEPGAIRMVGPAIDAIAIDDESQRTVVVLGLVAAGFGFVIACWRLRSVAIAALVTAAGVISAAATLALVFYTGVLEVVAFDRVAPQFGRADALMLASALIVYVLAIAAAIRLVDYYRDAEVNGMTQGAVEHAIVDGWPYWLLSPLMIAAVVGVLCLSDLLPAQKFGVFTGAGMIVGAAIVLSLVAVVLHRFAPTRDLLQAWRHDVDRARTPRWLNSVFECGITAHLAVLALAFAALGLGAYGMTRLDVEPRLPALVGDRAQLTQNYAWFAKRVGNAVPMEVILTVPTERTREADEPAEADGQQYRLTLEERMELMRDLEHGLADVEQIGAVVSPATAMPAGTILSDDASAVRAALEQHGYVRVEHRADSNQPTGRELWRLSARVTAATPGQRAVDYSEIVYRVRAAVNPILSAYEQRDMLVGALHQSGKKLEGAKVAILFRAPAIQAEPIEGSTEALLANLLPRSGVGGVTLVNLTAIEGSDRASEALRARTISELVQYDGVVAASVSNDEAIAPIAAAGANLVHVGEAQGTEESQALPLAQAGGPRPIRAVFTGEPPVASVANLELLVTLRQSAMYAIPVLALVLMFVAWHPVGGLLSLVPVLFPAAVSLGFMGWLGIDVDMGVVLMGAFAMAVAIDGTMSFLSWFHQGAKAGLTRPEAARLAYSRVAPGMLDTTLIAGLGLLVLALSGLAFMQHFALAAIGVMISAMAGTLMVLPAMATSPLGRFFNAEPADLVHADVLGPLKTDAARAEGAANDVLPGRTDAAAASQPAAPHRARTGISADDRQEAAEGPHASLHARLERLRRPTGDSPTS